MYRYTDVVETCRTFVGDLTVKLPETDTYCDSKWSSILQEDLDSKYTVNIAESISFVALTATFITRNSLKFKT